MGLFSAFRNSYGFTSYKDNRTAVTYDVPLLIVTYVCVLVSVATLIATLGIRGRERWSATARAMYAVAIGSIILACLTGSSWQVGTVKIKSPYVYRSSLPFDGYVGINVGLSAVNVTLDGYYRGQSGRGYVYYSERVSCHDYGKGTSGYNDFLRKGLPDPILKVIAFLTFDEGKLRWGRAFQASGHYAYALLWTSFAFWVVSNVLLCSVIVYGAYMFLLTGLAMVLACVVYHVCQSQLPLNICFGDSSLVITYSWCFWLTLGAGCLTLLLGAILVVCDHFMHDGVSEFFHLEKLIEDDQYEIDDRRESYGSILMDRRGSVVPPSSGRRGSIFLDPCRQPADIMGKLKSGCFPLVNSVSPGKSSEKFELASKFNPFHNEEDKMASPTSACSFEDQVRIQMECVCEDSEVCLSTKKPSLATLKEHRDNHANEKISSNGPTGNKYARNTKSNRRVSYQEGVFTIEYPRKGSPFLGERRGSISSVLDGRERSASQVSNESFLSEILHHSDICETEVTMEARRDSAEGSTSLDSGRCESGEGTDSDSGNKMRNVSGSSCDSEKSDVFVDIVES